MSLYRSLITLLIIVIGSSAFAKETLTEADAKRHQAIRSAHTEVVNDVKVNEPTSLVTFTGEMSFKVHWSSGTEVQKYEYEIEVLRTANEILYAYWSTENIEKSNRPAVDDHLPMVPAVRDSNILYSIPWTAGDVQIQLNLEGDEIKVDSISYGSAQCGWQKFGEINSTVRPKTSCSIESIQSKFQVVTP